MDKEFFIGKQITGVELDEAEQLLTIKFSNGSGVIIKARGQYCDEVWLEWVIMVEDKGKAERVG